MNRQVGTTHDLVIRGGTVYDGDGSPGQTGDVAIRSGVIAEIGVIRGTGREEIDAGGKIVAPGFVDIHTHYDGQAVWDYQLSPSSWNGVTTVLMGNCGVGFAPCKRTHRDALIELMEGVEDIPAPAMHLGLDWRWETFAEYLDVLASTPRDIDVAVLLPHAPVRVYVMGERALRLEPATKDDIARMREIVADAVRAGAFGVSTSRTTNHRSIAGSYTPTLLAREREILGILEGLKDVGRGLFQFVAEASDSEVLGEYQMVRRCLERTGVSALLSLGQTSEEPSLWRDLMQFADDAISAGVSMRPVAAPRAVGMLLGLEGSQNPFAGTATYRTIAHLPLRERVQHLRRPEVRARILSEDPMEHSTFPFLSTISFTNMFRFGRPSNYTPTRENSLAAIATREGRTPQDVAYDVLLEDEGMSFIYVPFANYVEGDLRVCEELLANRNVVMGLGDGGAHVGFIVDAGFPTWLLTYWARERDWMSVAEAIRRLTSDTADVAGFTDRGRLRTGMRADLNIIDFEGLALGDVYVKNDLPGGGKRLLQRPSGYDVTIVAGQVTYRSGVATGACPGKLVRSGSLLGVPLK